MIRSKTETFQYGARFSSDAKPSWKYWMVEDDFRRELKMAFFETKDLDLALTALKQKIANEVRKRV